MDHSQIYTAPPSTPAAAFAAAKAYANEKSRRRSSSRSTRSTSQTSNGSRKRKDSSATIHAPRSHSTPPFKISLNLVMKVQSMNDKEEFTMEPLELILNGENIMQKNNIEQSPFEQKRSNVADMSTISSRFPNFNDSVFSNSQKKYATESPDTVVASYQPQQLSTIQKSQQNSFVGEQQKNVSQLSKQSTESSKKKYPNKQHLTSYSCLKTGNTPKSFGSTFLQSPRPTEDEIPGNNTYPPCRLNFDDTQDAAPKVYDSIALHSRCLTEDEIPGDNTYPIHPLNFDDSQDADAANDENGGTSTSESIDSAHSVSFSDCSPKGAALNSAMDISHLSKTPNTNKIPCIHQRKMRIGFIANGFPMAVNVTLNIRTAEDKLDIEPIELLFDGQKMWRRSARQVAKEMEEQKNAEIQQQNDFLNASTATTKSLPTNKKAVITPKSALNYKRKLPSSTAETVKSALTHPYY